MPGTSQALTCDHRVRVRGATSAADSHVHRDVGTAGCPQGAWGLGSGRAAWRTGDGAPPWGGRASGGNGHPEEDWQAWLWGGSS